MLSIQIYKNKWVDSTQRYRIFFFTRKSLEGTHTLVLGIFCFFFFPSTVQKKKTNCFFFFPRKSLHATHSTEKIQLAKKGKKRQKNGIFCPKNGIFCRFSVFSLFFFFSYQKLFFFFPRKSLPTTHSLDFQRPEKKKNRAGKKKNTFFTHSLVYHQNPKILNFSGEKKKYGTFGSI